MPTPAYFIHNASKNEVVSVKSSADVAAYVRNLVALNLDTDCLTVILGERVPLAIAREPRIMVGDEVPEAKKPRAPKVTASPETVEAAFKALPGTVAAVAEKLDAPKDLTRAALVALVDAGRAVLNGKTYAVKAQ